MRNFSQKNLRKIWLNASVTLVAAFVLAGPLLSVQAQQKTETLNDLPPENITKSNFSLVVCDGPPLPERVLNEMPAEKKASYRPCDFNAAMMEVQHLINIAIVLGVLAAIFGFSYVGYLYITGVPSNITKARDIFKKLAIGFIIMLTAWFIVYQLLNWLTGDSGFGKLLGPPQ